MLTLYQPPASRRRRVIEEVESDDEREKIIIPAGKPYLTKVNGKLVLARDKKPKEANPGAVTFDLLGQVFGPRIRVIEKKGRSRSSSPEPVKLTQITGGGIPYVPQQQLTSYTAPMTQQVLPSAQMIQMPLSYPPQPPYLPPYSPFLPFPPHPHQPQNPPRWTLTPPKPSQKDFEDLKRFDADYKQRAGSGAHAASEAEHACENCGKGEKVVETIRTTITITKHICAHCGRLRSRKYHQQNPIMPGETPVPSFCRKCQKDASSTSGSDSGSDSGGKSNKRRPTKGGSKAKRNEKAAKPSKSPREDKSHSPEKNEEKQDSEPELDHELKSKSKPKAKKLQIENLQAKQKKLEKLPPGKYIIIEEELSETEKIEPRGRPRHQKDVIEPKIERRTLSPVVQSYARTKSRSAHDQRDRASKYAESNEEHREESPPPSRPLSPYFKHVVHEKSPPPRPLSPYYRYVAAPKHVEPLEEAKRQNKRRGIRQIFKEDIYEPFTPKYNKTESETSHVNPPERITQRKMAPRENSFEEKETVNSYRSRDSARRRRVERSNTSRTPAPWEATHVINPRPDKDKVIVVTETYTYVPKKSLDAEAARRAEEYVERTEPSRLARISEEKREASKYYQDDWLKGDVIEEPKAPKSRGYRRETYNDSEVNGSELGSDFQRAYEMAHENIPRAPTPPPHIVGFWADALPYPESSDDDTLAPLPRIKSKRKGKKKINIETRMEPSKHRPSFFREAIDSVTEKAASVPPPAHSLERRYHNEEAAIIPSSRLPPEQHFGTALTTNPRQSPRVDRHTFEEPVSELSIQEIENGYSVESRHVTFQEPTEFTEGSGRGHEGGWDTEGVGNAW